MNGVFERAITEAAKRRFNGQTGAEVALRAFWVGYCDALVCGLFSDCLTILNYYF